MEIGQYCECGLPPATSNFSEHSEYLNLERQCGSEEGL